MERQKIAIAILHCNDDEVILVRKVSEPNRWDFPGTHIAKGESPEQAASRVAQLATGLDIGPERFGNVIRDEIGRDDVQRVSYRANITTEEQERLTRKSPCGKRFVCVVHKSRLPTYIPQRYRRAMMQA